MQSFLPFFRKPKESLGWAIRRKELPEKEMWIKWITMPPISSIPIHRIQFPRSSSEKASYHVLPPPRWKWASVKSLRSAWNWVIKTGLDSIPGQIFSCPTARILIWFTDEIIPFGQLFLITPRLLFVGTDKLFSSSWNDWMNVLFVIGIHEKCHAVVARRVME